ncbi:MAG TPA: PorP/SprF family type IX secretion system membrane protein [Cytophagales bacterium]|nr:PorP/SprF family type IX secretion system membrane protein [Cytophagales bacterium]
MAFPSKIFRVRVYLITVYLFGICLRPCYTQDIQFSQVYSNLTYQNPAFAGSSQMHRFIFHNRYQWPRLDARFYTTYFSYDCYLSKVKSGLGFLAYRDYQGGSKIVSNYFAGQYANEIHLSSSLSLRLGAQLAYSSSTIDYSQFRYSQDFTSRGWGGNTYNQYGGDVFWYADVSAGVLLYTEKLWFGVATNHINRPTQTFYDHIENRLPMKTSVTAGYRFVIKYIEPYRKFDKPIVYAIIPTAHYKMQGKSDQLDLGVYAQLDRLLLGGWYRGIPFKNYSRYVYNNESLVLMAGLKYNDVAFAYSYDFTVSKLVRAGSGGAHELNITIYLNRERGHKKPHRFRTPCPDFFE